MRDLKPVSEMPPSGETRKSHVEVSSTASARRFMAMAAEGTAANPEQTLRALLQELVALELGSAALVRIGTGAAFELCFPPQAEPAPRGSARVFPELPIELSVPIGTLGELTFAASALAHDTQAGYAALLEQLAEIVVLVWRARQNDAAVDALRRQVAQLEKLAVFGELAAGIVHELNNPLTAIVAYSELLERTLAGRIADAHDVERLGRIREAGQRLMSFARDLVSYSRPEPDAKGYVDLEEVLDRALRFCLHLFHGTAVHVERQRGPRAMVHGSMTELTQVFVNLVTNAAQAMGERGGTLHVVTERAGDSFRILVADEGTGIDPGHLERIFEPYFSTKVRSRGAGLGLSIVRGIVADHGGRVTARNRSPHGAEFEVELPVDRSGPAGHDPA